MAKCRWLKYCARKTISEAARLMTVLVGKTATRLSAHTFGFEASALHGRDANVHDRHWPYTVLRDAIYPSQVRRE